MKTNPIFAGVILAVSCVFLSAACILRPESPAETMPEEAQSSIGSEQIGEAEQEVGTLYVPEDFQFVPIVKDEGEGKAGGWQTASNASGFVVTVSGKVIYRWECRLEVGMPIRSEKAGRILAGTAARISATIANEVQLPLLESRTWVGQGVVFCKALKDGMNAVFQSDPYHGLGARVRLNP